MPDRPDQQVLLAVQALLDQQVQTEVTAQQDQQDPPVLPAPQGLREALVRQQVSEHLLHQRDQ